MKGDSTRHQSSGAVEQLHVAVHSRPRKDLRRWAETGSDIGECRLRRGRTVVASLAYERGRFRGQQLAARRVAEDDLALIVQSVDRPRSCSQQAFQSRIS